MTVDEEYNRLYIAHGSIVQVVDLKTSKQIGIIPASGAHGIAIAKDLKKGFISNGKDTTVTVFDLKTNVVIAHIKVTGAKPDAIVYDKITQRIFTMNGKGNNATVIDANKDSVIGTIPLGGKPEFCVSDGKASLFVNLEDKNAIEEIDAISMTVLRTWSIAPGESPTGLAIDCKNRRLFSVCDNQVMVISDANSGSVITTVPIGDGPDAAAFDPEKMLVYSSNGDGTLTIIKDSANTYKVLENFDTQKGARTMALNPKTHHIYLSTAEFMPSNSDKPKQRPTIKPNTFTILDIELTE